MSLPRLAAYEDCNSLVRFSLFPSLSLLSLSLSAPLLMGTMSFLELLEKPTWRMNRGVLPTATRVTPDWLLQPQSSLQMTQP